MTRNIKNKHQKFSIFTCIFSAILFLFPACTKNLEEKPYSFLSEEEAFQTANDATVALNAVYERLRPVYGVPMLVLSDLNADEFYRREGSPGEVEIDQNLYTSFNTNFDNFYTNSYLLIDRANRVIMNVPGITMDVSKRNQIVGEAKFLRALGYFNLVRAFGDVPLVTTATSDVVNVGIAQTPANAVYEQIVSDLKDAESANLPVKYTASGEVGRATIGAVRSILAKVYLTRKDFANAAVKAKQVIDANTYSLFPDYKNVFPPENKNGIEHIFSVQYSCTKTNYGSSLGTSFAIYFSWPIQQGGGAYQPEKKMMDSYLPGDYRKQVTIISQKVNPATGALVQSRTGPHQDKYWDPKPCDLNSDRNNFMVIRYADVLLMYAEAQNELNGPTAAAYAPINQVRARARNGNNSANPQDLSGLSQEGFRNAILQERTWELCFEGHRRWDLLRTGKYISTLQAAGIPVQPKNQLYPIPQNERDVNPELKQNEGY